MNSSYHLSKGKVGVLISMPHNGQEIPAEIAATMTVEGKKVADTDWFIDRLYDFAQALGIYVIKPKYSRYVIDLNRGIDGVNLYPGANSTELCPTTAFDLSPLYLDEKQPSNDEIQQRITHYWQPYHQAITETLADLKQEFGKVVLLDAHSILSHVPRFFSGKLPDFNFGTVDDNQDISCAAELINSVKQLNFFPYTSIINGRFKGGYITRAYGDPTNNIHAIQLELSQSTYMNEPSDHYNDVNAAQVKKKLQEFVECLISFSRR
ncbi:MAG: N-formylglutamate deformylase [Colwellia sp.]